MVKIRIPKLENSIKLYLVGLVILNIILRIPRVGGIIGDDAFRVIWMGKVLSEGYTDLWTVSIFSFFGLYPFSFYPIGVPFILAGLFTIGLSYEVAVFLLSIVTCVIGAIGSYYLGEELLHSQEKGLIFSLLYSISPIFLRVSYYTITVRGPFMGVLPWFLLYSWKLYQNRERKYILHVVVLLILLAMIHRLAILMVFYVIPLVGVALLPAVVSVPKRIIQKISVFSKFRLPFTDKVQNIESSLRKHGILGNMGIFPLAITLLLLAGTYLIALLLIPIDPQKTVEVFLSNSTTLGVTVNLIIDYGLRLGIVCVFLPLGILYKLDSSYSTRNWYLHLSIILVTIFILPRSLYSSLILLPVFIYYSIEGLYKIFHKFGIGLTCVVVFLGSIVFTGFYYIITLVLLNYLVFACIVFMLFIILYSFQRRAFISKYKWHMLIFGIVLFSLVANDGLIETDPNYTLDAEELIVINCILDHNQSGIVFSMRSDLARRLLAYGVQVVVKDEDGITSLYYGWITPEEITTWTELETNVVELARTGSLFKYNAPYPEIVLWSTFYNTDLTNQTQANLALSLGLRYIIVEKTRDGTSSYFEDVSLPSPLLESAPFVGEMLCETESMIVYYIG